MRILQKWNHLLSRKMPCLVNCVSLRERDDVPGSDVTMAASAGWELHGGVLIDLVMFQYKVNLNAHIQIGHSRSPFCRDLR